MSANNLSKIQRNLIIITTLSASFLSVLMMFLLITAFPSIMLEFSINSTEVQWLTTSFMLTSAILIPITAYFIDTFKTKTVMVSAMTVFIIGTVISMLAPNFISLLIGRIIQGMGSGILMPFMQTIFFMIFPREKRGYAMGLAGMVINVAPAVGPPLSGLLLKYFGWRSLFYIPLPIAILILVASIVVMKNVTEQKDTEVDLLSILLSSIGFGGSLYGFTSLQASEPTSITLISLIIGIIAIALFVIRQIKLPIPMLELSVLKIPLFSLVSFVSVLAFSLLIVFETIIPMFAQNAQGLSPYNSGLLVMPGALTLAFVSFFAGKLFDRYGGKIIIILGFILLSLSAVYGSFFLEMNTPFVVTMVLFMTSMAGSALINMPIMTIGINALPDHLIAHGTSVIHTIRQFGGTVGLIFIVSFISKVEVADGLTAPSLYVLGVNKAFFMALLFALVGLSLSIIMKDQPEN